MKIAEYTAKLIKLVPPGKLWPRPLPKWLNELLGAIAVEFARVDQRTDMIIEEADPRTTVEMIEEHEASVGLPSTCVPYQPQSLEDRRRAVVAKLLATGGADAVYFEVLAATMGFEVEVSEYPSRKCGQPFMQPYYGKPHRHLWRVHSPMETQQVRFYRTYNRAPFGEPYATTVLPQPAITVSKRKCGSPFQEPYLTVQVHHAQEHTQRRLCGQKFMGPYHLRENKILECEFNRLKPAHTQIVFTYGD